MLTKAPTDNRTSHSKYACGTPLWPLCWSLPGNYSRLFLVLGIGASSLYAKGTMKMQSVVLLHKECLCISNDKSDIIWRIQLELHVTILQWKHQRKCAIWNKNLPFCELQWKLSLLKSHLLVIKSHHSQIPFHIYLSSWQPLSCSQLCISTVLHEFLHSVSHNCGATAE